MPQDSGADAEVIANEGAIDDCKAGNAAGIDDEALGELSANTQPDMRWLYPYDGTVFPGGTLAPELMWEGPAADAVYVHLHSERFDYRGCFKATADHRITIPQHAWKSAQASTRGPDDPFTLELATFSGKQASGVITESLIIAKGKLQGSIYYMTYGTPGSTGAAMANVVPGRVGETPVGALGCGGCHSLSANGSRFISYVVGFGESYSVMGSTLTPSPLQVSGGESTGIYPDGSLYVTTAHPAGVGPRTYFAMPISAVAGLFDAATGAAIGDSGIPINAMMPSFAPDGSMLAYNDFDKGGGHGIALADFSKDTRKFTNLRSQYVDDTRYAGWPVFLPDNSALVFALGASTEFSGAGAYVNDNKNPGPNSDLHILDITRSEPLLLARAMGFSKLPDVESDTTYLPFGAADLHQNYGPNLSPVGAGGYFWLFFDSIRNYGNRGVVRQIWGAAIDPASDGGYTSDPSHPAFYLAEQDITTTHLRAVAALSSCAADTHTCSSDTDCCSGSCAEGACAKPEAPMCSAAGSLCSADVDCCDRAQRCIDSFCSSAK